MSEESLTEERKRLSERLQLINVKSPGRDRIIQRIEAIDYELSKVIIRPFKALETR